MNSRNSLLAPAATLGLLLLLFVLFVLASAPKLPERAATHFGISGQPDAWMSRHQTVLAMAAGGVGVPLFVCGVAFLTRFLPACLINIPARHYWLAPERRAATAHYLLRQTMWLMCLLVMFFAGLYWQIIIANQESFPHLRAAPFLLLTGCFLGAGIFWSFRLIRQFRHVPAL